MKNKTIDEIFSQVMENYTYSVKREGSRIEITGNVFIDGIERTITHKKTFRLDAYDKSVGVEGLVCAFREEFGERIRKVILQNYELLSDDQEMIKYLNFKIKQIKDELEKVKDELEKEKIKNIPLVQPYQPWMPNTVPCDNPYKPITITYATDNLYNEAH